MTFTQALEQYLSARDNMIDAPANSRRFRESQDLLAEAQRHMDALTQEPPE